MSSTRFSTDHDIQEACKRLVARGWRIRQGRHLILYAPNGRGIVTLSRTPNGGRRSLQNFLADVRRAERA